MKKLLIISLIAGSLVATPTIANAATKAPKPQISGGAAAEGSAEHEAGEGKKVEKSEKAPKKKVIKKKK